MEEDIYKKHPGNRIAEFFGFVSRKQGLSREENPYPEGDENRPKWFVGYDMIDVIERENPQLAIELELDGKMLEDLEGISLSKPRTTH